MKNVYQNTTFLDKRACEKYQLTPELLMENAASALEHLLSSLTHKGSVITILCGSGDNGGDGYALARRICGDYHVRIYQVKEPKSSLCIQQSERLCECELKFIKKILPCDVVVDCVVGSGLKGELDKDIYEILKTAQKNARIRVACDIPSGLNEQTLRNDERELRIFKADYTLCMGAIKLALLSDVAKDYVGNIHVANLGLSSSHYEVQSHIKMLETKDLKLPLRTQSNTHKGDYGHAGVYMGEKCGAAILTAQATLAFGTGLVSIITDSQHSDHTDSSTQDNLTHNNDIHNKTSLFESYELNPQKQEYTLIPAHNTIPLSFALPNEIMLSSKVPYNATAVAFGMGLGIKRSETLLDTLHSSPLPCVLDADVFYASNIKLFLEKRAQKSDVADVILTPHPKEFDSLLRICGLGTYIPNRRADILLDFTQKYPNTILLLKGANVFIACTKGIYINPLGTNALAKGGSGDVLSGLILALLAQGFQPLESALISSLAHSLAAQNALSSFANYALTPTSLIESIRTLAHTLHKGL